jgi:predicted Zn-dependent peptidase
MINDYPDQKVDALIGEMLWPEHPLGREVCGVKESVAGITRDMLIDHVARFYTPENMVVSVAGDIEHDQVVGVIDSLAGGWMSRPAAGWARFSEDQSSPRLRMEYRKTEQVHLSLGLPGLSLTHPNRYALDLVSVILGESMSSRLFLEVREKKGLAYDVHSAVAYFLDCGAFIVNAGVDPGRVQPAVDTILAEVGRMKEGVPDDELQMAKQLTVGRLSLRMEGTRPVSAWMGSQEALLGRILDVEEVIDGINAVTAEDLRRVSGDLLKTEKLNLAVVGPTRARSRLERSLKL